MDSHNTAQLTQLQVAFVGEDKIETRGVQQLLCTKEKKKSLTEPETMRFDCGLKLQQKT